MMDNVSVANCWAKVVSSLAEYGYNVEEKERKRLKDIKALDDDYLFIFSIKGISAWEFGFKLQVVSTQVAIGTFYARSTEVSNVFGDITQSFIEELLYFSVTTYGQVFSVGGINKVLRTVKFIEDEPELAFCRDYCGWDYNEEYHTKEEAIEVIKERDKNKDE